MEIRFSWTSSKYTVLSVRTWKLQSVVPLCHLFCMRLYIIRSIIVLHCKYVLLHLFITDIMLSSIIIKLCIIVVLLIIIVMCIKCINSLYYNLFTSTARFGRIIRLICPSPMSYERRWCLVIFFSYIRTHIFLAIYRSGTNIRLTRPFYHEL